MGRRGVLLDVELILVVVFHQEIVAVVVHEETIEVQHLRLLRLALESPMLTSGPKVCWATPNLERVNIGAWVKRVSVLFYLLWQAYLQSQRLCPPPPAENKGLFVTLKRKKSTSDQIQVCSIKYISSQGAKLERLFQALCLISYFGKRMWLFVVDFGPAIDKQKNTNLFWSSIFLPLLWRQCCTHFKCLKILNGSKKFT